MPAARDEDWTAIAAQAAAGATLVELAEHWNIPVGTLKDRCAKEGWKRYAREIHAKRTGTEVVTPQHQTIQPRPTDRAVSLMGKLGERSKLRLIKTVDKTAKALYRQGDEKLIANTGALRNTTGAWKDLCGTDGGHSLQQININLSNTQLPEKGP